MTWDERNTHISKRPDRPTGIAIDWPRQDKAHRVEPEPVVDPWKARPDHIHFEV